MSRRSDKKRQQARRGAQLNRAQQREARRAKSLASPGLSRASRASGSPHSSQTAQLIAQLLTRTWQYLFATSAPLRLPGKLPASGKAHSHSKTETHGNATSRQRAITGGESRSRGYVMPSDEAATHAKAASYRPPARTTATPLSTPREMWLWIGGLYLVSRAVLTAVGVLARQHIGFTGRDANVQEAFGIGTGQAWLDVWGAWDTRWYYHIAEFGYSTQQSTEGHANYAFFPLYPYLARIGGWLFAPFTEGSSSIFLGGLLVSNLALLVAAYLLYRWMELEKGRDTARLATLFLFLFPTAYVFSAMMSEGLFIALSIGAWYAARRGNFWIAGLLGGLSAMTRSLGIVIAMPLGLEYMRQHRWQWRALLQPRILAFALVPAGLGVFMIIIWQVIGNPLAFVDIHKTWGSGGIGGGSPFLDFYRAFAWWNTDDGFFGVVNMRTAELYAALSFLTVVALLVGGAKHIGMPLLLWSLVIVVVPPLLLQGGVGASTPRYLVVVFPLFVLLAMWSAQARHVHVHGPHGTGTGAGQHGGHGRRSARGRILLWTLGVVLAVLQAITFALWTSWYGIAI